jgi:hypothetical protein
MAAFRIREAANRIATLANSAQNETLRRELLSICQRLVNEERALLDADAPGPSASACIDTSARGADPLGRAAAPVADIAQRCGHGLRRLHVSDRLRDPA